MWWYEVLSRQLRCGNRSLFQLWSQLNLICCICFIDIVAASSSSIDHSLLLLLSHCLCRFRPIHLPLYPTSTLRARKNLTCKKFDQKDTVRSLHHKQMENITPSSANKACISGREAAQGMAAMLYARKSSLHKYYLSCPHSPFIGNSIQAHSPATTFTSYVSSWEYLDSFSWFALCL